MDWPTLMNSTRSGARAPEPTEAGRSAFERDASRILFANAFRRLHAKTQVFPVPEHDHVHTRLTHSLEVADVGRSLGAAVGQVVVARHALAPELVRGEHLAQVVAAACLAHDLGNPPFGHAGEDAIGYCFTHGPGAALLTELDATRADEFRHFEGNAQGFRILTRTSMYRDAGGMRLTAATLGAFTKYPQLASRRRDPQRPASGKKYGCFSAERDALAAVADACGLPAAGVDAWERHPLAWLMEAADDICYHILDLEDGAALGLVTADEVVALLAPILDRSERDLAGRAITALRAQAIHALVEQSVAAFLDHEPAILAGSHQQALCDGIPAARHLAAIGATNLARCYRARVVLGLEEAGYTVIGGLLERLLAATFGERNPHLRQLLPEDFDARLPELDTYQRLLAITDFVSGMTDRYAVRLYRQLTGISLDSV